MGKSLMDFEPFFNKDFEMLEEGQTGYKISKNSVTKNGKKVTNCEKKIFNADGTVTGDRTRIVQDLESGKELECEKKVLNSNAMIEEKESEIWEEKIVDEKK